MPKLYIVGTPIGNLEDITLRAVRILGEVDLILAEDTRVTRKLLDKHEIKTPLERFDAKTEAKNPEKILNLLKDGKDLALVSDAGTPAISDPGGQIIKLLRSDLNSLEVVVVPGPSALTAALSIAGLSDPAFIFLGFLPHKKGRKTIFEEIAKSSRNVIFFESPHRIMKTLKSLQDNMPIYRHIIVLRELTKMYEEVVSGSAVEILRYFENNPEKQRGEFVVVVEA